MSSSFVSGAGIPAYPCLAAQPTNRGEDVWTFACWEKEGLLLVSFPTASLPTTHPHWPLQAFPRYPATNAKGTLRLSPLSRNERESWATLAYPRKWTAWTFRSSLASGAQRSNAAKESSLAPALLEPDNRRVGLDVSVGTLTSAAATVTADARAARSHSFSSRW